MHFTQLDWLIVGAMMAGLAVMALISNRHTKSVADYLAAGRAAGRYMMTMASGMVWIGAINVVAMFELYYEAGFTAMWWVMLSTPFAIYMAITGFGIYRFRETRALTVAQFLEQRYSRNVRVLAGILAWVAGLINFGIFPAVGARFFVAFCGMPESVELLGLQVATFPLVMFVLLAVSLFFVFAGGHVAVIVTDCLQGMFTQVVAVVIVIVLMASFFDWGKIMDVLLQAPAGESMLDPFHTNKMPDFNMWYFLVSIVGMWYAVLSHLPAQAYNASAKTAHEARMGGVLNQWRWLALCLFFMVLVLCAMTVMKHPDYADVATQINARLDGISTNPANATRKQLTVTMALSHIFPTGLAGLFCAVMVAALVSTYDSFMHSWGAVMGTAGVFCNQLWPKLFEADFPLNPQWIWFITIITCTALYIGISLLERERFNLKKLLHRGDYAIEADQTHVNRAVSWRHRLFGIDREFKALDRATAYMIVGWFLVFLAVFLGGTVYALVASPSEQCWALFWRCYLGLLFVLAIGVTIWLTWGGFKDMVSLFRALRSRERDFEDDGMVREE